MLQFHEKKKISKALTTNIEPETENPKAIQAEWEKGA